MVDGQELTTALRRGTLEYCVLGLVARREMYGAELVHELGAALGMATSEGTVYPLLSRLRRAGRLDTVWADSPVGPPRRYYRLSPSGRAALEAFRLEWGAFRDGVDQIMRTDDVPGHP